VEKAAAGGDTAAFDLPRAWLRETYDFSFSGLKTAMLRLVQKYAGEDAPQSLRKSRDTALPPRVMRQLSISDLAASFQNAVVEVLVEKTRQAATERSVREVLLAGGVAANKALRQAMSERLAFPVRYPPLKFCTDNAAMVASAGYFQFRRGDFAGWEMDVLPNLGLVKA
jgi:N6-L-threonylcarbamoyladenine synthase